MTSLETNLGFTPVNPGREIASYLVARGGRPLDLRLASVVFGCVPFSASIQRFG